MKPEKVLEVVKGHEEYLLSSLYTPERMGPELRHSVGSEALVNHILWMCQEVPRFLVEQTSPATPRYNSSKVEKAMRWLGFIQGCLYCLGEYTIDELKKDNMPDEEKVL